MRASEEYIQDNIISPHHDRFNSWTLDVDDAKYAVNLAYKEGYNECKADILELLRQEDAQLFMVSAITLIRKM
jgi:hypothetical protein